MGGLHTHSTHDSTVLWKADGAKSQTDRVKTHPKDNRYDFSQIS